MRAALAMGSKSLPFNGSVKKGNFHSSAADPAPEVADTYLSRAQSREVSGRPEIRPAFAENFLFPGSSALLLLVANLFPHYWYISFFALIPFLYRIIKLGALGSLQLGLVFGFSFFAIYKLSDFFAAPLLTGLTAALGAVLFALFGWAAARAKEKFGFNPLFIALLWVGLELCLLKLGVFSVGAGSPRPFLIETPAYFHGLSVLFGFLAVSFVIVLVNSLLVFAIEKTVSLAKARGPGVWVNESVWDLAPIPGLFAQKVYFTPQTRGPPLFPEYKRSEA